MRMGGGGRGKGEKFYSFFLLFTISPYRPQFVQLSDPSLSRFFYFSSLRDSTLFFLAVSISILHSFYSILKVVNYKKMLCKISKDQNFKW